MDDLPDHFDLVVVGTGLTETILAAAASRAGRSVLQLDRRGYYGAEWASLSLLQWEEWVAEQNALQHSPTATYHNPFFNVELVTDFGTPSAQSHLSHDDLRGMSSKFSIDLCPRLVFSKGALVDLLVQSNICRYLEFKNCTKLLIHESDSETDRWLHVPCTRDAVFNDKQLSLVQKRKFMKFIDKCARLTTSENEVADFRDQPFDHFLSSCGLDRRLTGIITSVVGSVGVDTMKSLKYLERFIESSGRFGPTPFLWTLYGCGELPQAFARLSAVFGGVYCLSQEVLSMEARNESVRIKLPSKEITCKFVAGSVTSLPARILTLSDEILYSHAVCVTDKSIGSGDQHDVTSGRVSQNGLDLSVIEVGSGSLCVPPGLFLVFISCKSKHASAKEDLMPLFDLLFFQKGEDGVQGRVLWSCFFNKSSPQQISCIDHNVHVFRNASQGVDYELEINEAKSVFHQLFPDDAFLPRAPDAEDIVIEDRDDQAKSEPE